MRHGGFVKNIILIIISFFYFQKTQAQQFKVTQVKGNKAIVEVMNGDSFNVGNTYSVSENILEKKSSLKNQRQNLLGLSFSISNSKTDLANSTALTSMDISARYGWNKSQYEFGPIGLFNYSDSGSAKSTTFGGGVFGTYNINENKPGTELVFAVEGTFVYSIKKITSGSLSYDDTSLNLTAGPYAKWFILSNDFCISAGVVYSYNSYKPGVQSSSSYNTNTFALTGGIANYF